MTGASRRGQAFLGLIDPEVAGQAAEEVERTAGPSPALAGFPVERVGFGASCAFLAERRILFGGVAMVAGFAETIAEGPWVLAASSRSWIARRIRGGGVLELRAGW
jgi:hypothetical protein